MYVVMNRLACPISYAEHLERAFRHAGNMQGVPGFASFKFLRQDADDPAQRHYAAVTEWENKKGYEAWRKSESFERVHSGSESSPVVSSLECFDVLE